MQIDIGRQMQWWQSRECVGGGVTSSLLKIVDDFIATRRETIARQPDCDF